MIQPIWSVLSQAATIDMESGSVSLFNIIETLSVFGDPQKPFQVPAHFELLSLWTRSDPAVPEYGRMRVTLVTPGGEEIPQTEMPIDLSTALYSRTRLHGDRISLKGPGRYVFQVDLRDENDLAWISVASIPVLVIFNPPRKNGPASG